MPEEHTSSIEDKLHQAWRQERRYYHFRGASRLAIWLIALLALSFVIDWGIISKSGLNSGFGILLLLVIIVVLSWVLWHEWLRHLKPFDPVLMALDVEERHPHLSSLMVSYVQLEKPMVDQPNVSSELIAAMRVQAVTTARPFDFREVVDFRQLRNLFLVAAGVVLLFGALSISWGEHFGTLMQRLVGFDAEYPTKTQVGSVSNKIIVRVGDSTTIVATAAGEIPSEAILFTRPADAEDAEWKELPMKRVADAARPSFSRELKDLTSDLAYFVEIGDDRSDEYRLKVVPAPQVVKKSLKLEFEPYMRREPKLDDQLNLEVPEGTKITWNLTCDSAVKKFLVETDKEKDAKPIVAEIDETGKKLTFTETADKGFRYTFRWIERESGEDFEFDDLQYRVTVLADVAPQVELLSPSANGLATLKKKLTLKARATDDYGLAEARLVYSLDGADEKRIPLVKDFGGAKGKVFTHVLEVQNAIEGLKLDPQMIDPQVTFAIEVSDFYPGEEKHWSRSATRQLTIVNEKRYLDWYLRELAAQTAEMKRAREAERLSKRKVGEIKTQEDESQ